jgi:hypothetical protein
MANPLLALLAGRALPQAQQVVWAIRLADVVRDLGERLDDLETLATRIESFDRRVTALERRLEDGGKPPAAPRRARRSKN